MGKVIEVDFVNHERLEGVDEYDREYTRLLDDLHTAIQMGGVAFDELNEDFARFARAIGV